MIELFVTNKDFFSVYFSDLNVPIAYVLLTVSLIFICICKKVPLVRIFFLWIFSGFGVACLLDAVYDYTVKIFIFHNMSLGEGLIFLLFPIPVYALSFFIWKYGELKRMLFLIFPIMFEIYVSFTNIDYSAYVRYLYVLFFIFILLGLKNKK